MVAAVRRAGAKGALNVNIPHEGANLVSARPTDNPISSWHKVSPGVYVNTHSSTSAKKTQLEKLFKALHLNFIKEQKE